MNLLIIGNGFDIAHDMKTTYLDFKSWIEENYDLNEPCYLDNLIIDEEGKFFDDQSAALFLVRCLENFNKNMWKDFEKMLGMIDWSSFQDEVEDLHDKEGDLDVTKTMYNYEYVTSKLISCIDLINGLFSQWINSVETTELNHDIFQSEDFKNSMYLTFNYTDTLEKKYMIDESKIYHIHGTKYSEIILGHSNEEQPLEAHDYNPLSIESDVLENLLRKPSKKIISSQSFLEFIKKLKSENIHKIFSWGFSFSDIDMIYFEYILCEIDTNEITWYFNSFDSHEHEEYKNKLRNVGFKGKFDVFKTDTVNRKQ